MIYKHQYFQLDTESRKVFDENKKELALTGNAYRLLVFLCKKGNATLTDINDYFDPAGAKEYTENHVRQYKYRINSIIGHRVVTYKNFIYSINGAVSKSDGYIYSSLSAPKPLSAAKNASEYQDRKSASKSPHRWLKKLTPREKMIIPFLLIFLVIFSATVLGDKNNKNESRKISSEAAESSPKPQEDMVLIPAGEFLVGSTEQQALEAWRQNDGGWRKEDYFSEYPQRKIRLEDFYIDKKEVSNSDYKIFISATDRTAPSPWNDQALNQPNQPVVGVDWNDADAYCRWLGKRLPTEAEWEKSARGPEGRIWPWGNTWNPKKSNHGKGSGYGFDEADGYKFTAPVGVELGVSPYGVLNMAGNVYEWTSDDFNAYPGNDKYLQEDFGKGFKVIKGGAYTDGQSEQRPASRVGYPKNYKDVDIGFRCAKDK